MLVLPHAAGTDKSSGQIGFSKAPRVLQTQTIAFIMAAPALTHAVYRARKGAAPDPSADFLMEYFSFGFLFAKDEFAIPALHIGPVWAGLLLVFSLMLLLCSLKAPKREAPIVIPRQSIPIWIPIVAAIISASFMFWLASIAHRRNEALMALSVLPFMALIIPSLASVWRRYIPRLPSSSLHRLQEKTILLWLIAVISPLVLFAMSYKVSILAPRAFLIFIPYYLILCAAGALHVVRHQRLRWIAVSVTLLVFAASIPYSAHKPGSPNDYRGLAESMQIEMKAGDLILLRDRNWVDTPLLYYIPDARLVLSDYATALKANPEARVWLITWPFSSETEVNDARRDALKNYDRVLMFKKLRASAELFERNTNP